MKKSVLVSMAIAASLMMGACNNSGKGSVNNADSANSAKMDSGTVNVNSDEAEFMVDAANGGMTEVKLGQIAQQKAHNQRVKDFAAMMVRDHTAADNKLETLANSKNVTLPDSLSEDSQDDVQKLNKKSGTDFDEAYMDMMVKGHKKTVNAMQSELKDVKNPDLKQWISNTLPTVQMHLDSAQSIDQMYDHSNTRQMPTTAP
jgi:putative membrane protein